MSDAPRSIKGAVLALLVTLLACKKSAISTVADASPSPSLAPSPAFEGLLPPSQHCPPEVGNYELAVSFEAISITSNCFFFSGPGTLGRDTQLGSTGHLRLGAQETVLSFASAEFKGSTSGGRTELSRSARYTYQGPWQVDETIQGEWQTPAASVLGPKSTNALGVATASPCPEFHGQYAYRECSLAPGEHCPGRCRIAARLVAVVAR